MHTFIRNAGTIIAGAVLAGAGLLVTLPATSAHAATVKAAPVAGCTQTAAGWICYLRYCDAYYCYYDCYPTAYARAKGDRPSQSIRVPKPEGTPPAQIDKP
ncbi:hypothetical protein OHA77_15910 [Streptosporangium sp. NBC_01639]|uniref:hypothetical protein n=1 Tax=Streptosporangium sp. NBC_01639 TaxID=2975948 RepID=UPI003865DFE6|nr:hypothetical protein OHA77_15910 [Streptosporangium sp. NBC_01639]